MKKLSIGVDIGSTTVKMVVLDKNENILYSEYRRHFSDTKKTIIELFNEVLDKFKNVCYSISLTGSGAISLSEYLKLDFVQEVIACKNAIKKYAPSCDVAIELGGEDAKIIYFDQTIEQRMNASCAGGTGAFLDQMAILLNTTTEGLNDLALKGEKIYPIASRCGVFAKTDIQPLLNEGAKKEDIALSIMQAVVNQTISGLACGRPIKGNILFLGGPLNYLTSLKQRFIETLNLKEDEILSTDDPRLFVCLGAVLNNENTTVFSKTEVKEMLKKLDLFKEDESTSIDKLFKSDADYKKFVKRHSKNKVKRANIDKYKGDIFIGIDAGSTTAKVVAISNNGEILYENYKSNKGTPVDTIKEMLIDLYSKLNKNITIRQAGSTGYGELLVKTAFDLDISEIETMAHFEAANYFLPEVESIIDIGGQDMKYIKIKDGAVSSIMLNEACSSGCGSFIETLAKSLNMSVENFVEYAITSKNPIDLGSRCTVFMNSKIKQTQKEGKPLSDIFAGLSYSVVRNALQKVMKIRDFSSLGDKIVVQGGTFLNDAILKAFENITKKEVIRPDIAGLMGAYGVALLALKNYNEIGDKNIISSMLSLDDIKDLKVKTNHARCGICQNHCALTINIFGKKKFISGNRCERGSGNNGSINLLPNMYSWKYDLLFNYESIKDSKRGKIGIPRVLNMYENYPLWHTILSNLGFEVVLSDHSNRNMYEDGIESMPSESVCYPAKLVHGHIINLIKKGLKTIFYPCIMYEKEEFKNQDNKYNCPIVQSYSEAIRLNVEDLEKNNIKFINPFLPMDEKKLVKTILEHEVFKEYKFSKKEVVNAVHLGFIEQDNFKEKVRKKGEECLKFIEKNNEKALVLAGRPYHLDKEVNHGIDTMINSLGLAIITEDAICHLSDIKSNLRVVNQWTYHSRVYHAADVIKNYKNIELVNLNSFGCGLDAIVTDQLEEILKANNKLFTTIKIDEINNLGAAKIRIRSLLASMNRKNNKIANKINTYKYEKNYFKEEDKKNTILFPDMSPAHMPFFESVLKSSGYNAVYLNKTTDKTVEDGLNYVNNDSCYPAIIVVGQLIHALKSGKYDTKNTSVIITQTGGGCRATNYIGLIRKALVDAGFSDVSILSFNLSGLEKEQAFKVTPKLANKLLQSITYGDLLIKLLLATRPYEIKKGEADNLYKKWQDICYDAVSRGRIVEFRKNIKNIIEDFNNIEVKLVNKPKVGIVGEILIKYHAYGNDNLIKKLEKEGAEVTQPDLMGFIKYSAYNSVIKDRLLKTGKISSFIYNEAIKFIELYEKTMTKYLKNTRFRLPVKIKDLEKNVDGIISVGNQTGEGWFLTAEMIELIKDGITNIVCVQPFACLPNHIVGKAVIKKIRKVYPNANITPIDYDPGASHTNQTNRIKLMLTVAKENLDK